MASIPQKQQAFDFSQDAQTFKERLHQQIMAKLSTSSVSPVDDDDLEWISAAGNPHFTPDIEDRRGGKFPSI